MPNLYLASDLRYQGERRKPSPAFIPPKRVAFEKIDNLHLYTVPVLLSPPSRYLL